MYFAIVCFDKPGVGELREKTHDAHLTYLKQHSVQMHLGGPFENDEGAIVGTLFIVNVEDHAAANSFTENEPFHKAGVFESVIVRRWRQMQPEIELGANAITAKEASLQMKEEGQV
jgi:uncharacterized protein YciI